MELMVRERFEQLKVCVVIPTYNNSATLGSLLGSLLVYTNHLIVVNDGSTDDTENILSRFPEITQISYSRNKGKGWALRSGFKKAIETGYDYAITIDSDGQHFAEDLPRFLDKLEELPECLIIGKRNMEQSNIPGKSSFGNKFSNFWYWFETGYKMDDTQCGYRLYPVRRLSKILFFTRKFEFEIEVIVRAAWMGIPVTSVPVRIHYDEKGKRISHFRPFQDFTRISILNTVLVTIALLYIKPRDIGRKLSDPRSRRMLFNQLFHTGDSNARKAAAVGFGVFMGIFPVWGFQMILAIAFSVLFRLNKALVLIAANISFPPFIPLILYLSTEIGKIYMAGSGVDISFSKSITLSDLQNSFVQYMLGAVTLAIGAGIAAGLITWVFLQLPKRSNRS
jgi:glycosyltransferase involved in cell wall biosynthesis